MLSDTTPRHRECIVTTIRAWLAATAARVLALLTMCTLPLVALDQAHDALAPGLFAFALVALLAALATVLAARAADVPGGLERVRAGTLRALAMRLAFLPLRDPDARGRTRPRAPGAAPAVA
jgi:hypothetical protein